jgi:hypothetical protein
MPHFFSSIAFLATLIPTLLAPSPTGIVCTFGCSPFDESGTPLQFFDVSNGQLICTYEALPSNLYCTYNAVRRTFLKRNLHDTILFVFS